ncbi:YiiX/YebB-like N1pC/P60 family cysteine hydrolase [Liquorilactobacillus ghanensis]|uniref:YiiX/YebB-like N1pC/P60 family cysteine hydrolase n=1 Tax=Liquorilactobacillus ghanensis TaxID=399370 RepID=UPI0039E8F0D2
MIFVNFTFYLVYIDDCEERPLNLLKTGDLLFVRTDNTDALSRQIAAATQITTTERTMNYTHVGFLEEATANCFWVMHASPRKGCCREALADFLQENQTGVDAYRLQGQQIDYTAVTQRARQLLGSPYNFSFIADQPGYYCSEFICTIFKQAKLFKSIPMQFGPDKQILPAWQDYYQQLKLSVPVGQFGSSPNSLIAQTFPQHLKFIARIV